MDDDSAASPSTQALVETPAPTPRRQGTLRAWWRQGLRSALFLKPDWSGLQATPLTMLCLVLAPFLVDLLAQRLYVAGPADFQWQAALTGWLPTAVAAWACWLLTPRAQAAERADTTPGTATLFSMLAAQSLALAIALSLFNVPMMRSDSFNAETLGRWGIWAAWLIPLAWVMSAQLWLLGANSAQRRATKAMALALVAAVMVISAWAEPARFWYPSLTEEGAGGQRPEPLELTQATLERQPQLLAEQLQALAPQKPGKIDVYAITFAPYAEADVFKRESALVADVMRQRFGAEGRTLQLVNHKETIRQLPWATPLNLQRAIRRVAALMDRDEDVLFIHLTSHGAREGQLAASFWPLDVDEVTPQQLKAWLDEAGIRWRIVSISACYSGSWIAPLADEKSLVMTAADAEHTSYGCGRRSELTYFGRAMYDEQLRQTRSFEQAHAAARKVIERREVEGGKTDGFSNPQLRMGGKMREHLPRLEAQLAHPAPS